MSLAVPSSMKFMFRKNRQNLPVLGSMSKRRFVPTGNWQIVSAVINGASSIPRQRFPGNKRYFVLLDANGVVIPSSFIASTTVPVGEYMEVFANGVITVADDSATDPGGVVEDFEDVQDIPALASSDYLQNGYKYSGKVK